jgi:hypothetical protein
MKDQKRLLPDSDKPKIKESFSGSVHILMDHRFKSAKPRGDPRIMARGFSIMGLLSPISPSSTTSSQEGIVLTEQATIKAFSGPLVKSRSNTNTKSFMGLKLSISMTDRHLEIEPSCHLIE